MMYSVEYIMTVTNSVEIFTAAKNSIEFLTCAIFGQMSNR